MRDWHAIIEALEAVPVIGLHGTLARMLPLGDFLKNLPPDFLFTSGKPNRYIMKICFVSDFERA